MIVSLYYHELMGTFDEPEGKKYLMFDDYMLDKVLGKIKMIIGIGRFDDNKILIETDDKLRDDVTLKNVVISIT